MVIAAIDAATGTLILGIATLFFGFLGTLTTGIMTYLVTKLNQSQKDLVQGQKEVKAGLEVVHATTNGMSEKLSRANIQQGISQGTLEERDRALKEQAAVARGAAEERVKAETAAGATSTTVNRTLAENVQVVKKDVQEVTGDVKVVKDATKNMSTNPKTGD